MSAPSTRIFEFDTNQQRAGGHERVWVRVGRGGVRWGGEIMDGPSAGAYGMGPPQTHAECLSKLKVDAPPEVAHQIRALCQAFLDFYEDEAILAWDRRLIARHLGTPLTLERHDAEGWTALTKSVAQRWNNEVRLILATGINCEQRMDGRWSQDTPLILACRNVNADAIDALLSAGARIPVEEASTPCCLSIILTSFVGRGQRYRACTLLLDAGVSVHGKKGTSPLHTAIYRRQLAIAQLFLDHGADINGVSHRTPLGMAAQACDVNGVTWCLERGADPHLRDAENKTARDLAYESNCVEHKEETIDTLEKWGV